MATTATTHRIGTRAQWQAAHAELLEREKEHTRMGGDLARRRRSLPWVPVEKKYTLHTADGPTPLAQLFAGRSQLLIYHFMFGPSDEAGFTAFTLEDGVIYQTYSTTGRGVEFLMPYYGILDRAPKRRDEGEAWQLWIRRRDEYGTAAG